MYVPQNYREDRPEVLHDLVRHFGFATLITSGSDGALEANHLPIFLDTSRGQHGVLRGHVARPNTVWQSLAQGRDVLCVFLGPHAYVSPAWYRSAGPHVPTWNYAAVHIWGRPRLIEGPELRRHLFELVEFFESEHAQPWSARSLPEEFLDRMQRAIVGFEIEITRIQGKRKLGQNRTKEDREGAATALASTGDSLAAEIAQLMRSIGTHAGP
jgi:transcriptional regulator